MQAQQTKLVFICSTQKKVHLCDKKRSWPVQYKRRGKLKNVTNRFQSESTRWCTIYFYSKLSYQTSTILLHLKMSLQWSSVLKRAILSANNNSKIAGAITNHKKALSQLATSRKLQPNQLEKNIVASPHADCTLLGTNMVQRFFDNADKWQNKVALVNIHLIRVERNIYVKLKRFSASQECGVTGRKYTYEMTRQLIRRYASALPRAGFKKGEVMGMVSPNVPEFPIALLGASAAGMPVALVNPTFTPGVYIC